ncbi:MAG TPA: cytochrome P450 [Nevskiaceae bacterium]|nr:cytochrome P450 [Nevskiaceae bacterium]
MPEIPPIISFEPGPGGVPSSDVAYSPDVPVCPMRLPTTGEEVLVLKSRAPVVAALASRDFSITAVDQDRFVTTGSAFRSPEDLLRLDPPATTTFRRPIGASFSESAIEKWRPHLEQKARALATKLESHPSPTDLIASYTEPFLAEAVTSTLGVPQSEWPTMLRLADTTLGSVQNMQDKGGITLAWEELYTYCDDLIENKRTNPDGSIFSNVVKGLEKANKSHDEILHACATILVGFPTPLPVLNVAAAELLRRPDTVSACLENPSLWAPTVKELLRYKAHFATVLPRIAMKDVQIGGIQIPAGQVVLPSLAAAAHDPEKVERPAECDPSQDASRNIVFGAGPHLCPGAALTRQWLEVSLGQLFTAHPKLRLAVPAGQLSWQRGGLSAPATIPVIM